MEIDKIIVGDSLNVLKSIPDDVIDCCITSPPYYNLRDYGIDGQIGNEDTPEKYIDSLKKVFGEIYRVLKENGTLWVNIGDSYNGSGGNHKPYPKKDLGFQGEIGYKYGGSGCKVKNLKDKDLIGIPWMLAFALRDNGWYLRQDIIWAKGNPMPESVKDRCTKSHEYIFLLSKNKDYYYDYEAIKENATTEPKARDKNKEGYKADYITGERFSKGMRVYGADGMRNKRDVWFVNTKPNKESHFATFPPELIKPCILAGCREGGIVLDPFMGSGTTAIVAKSLNRHYIGIELNPEYVEIANNRIKNTFGLFL